MTLRKQEFYEGAALHLIVRSGALVQVEYKHPFFLLNGTTHALLKYSTKKRSPWSFTFTPGEQAALASSASVRTTVIALICGSDGVVGLEYHQYMSISGTGGKADRVACARAHGKHYSVSGPSGAVGRKIPSSKWCNLNWSFPE